ncbi:hypothetical protein L3073_03755 [Ancylomarina sp. DW003]|nr:hypothetical protein [Ancylomarina sp. DW003]MDE5421312.1 hypothetical protein [Ancylomarina sp. DW003]
MPHLKYQMQKRITRLISKHYKGFGIDSPYIYHLIRNVIEAKMHYYPFKKLDRQCQTMLSILKAKSMNENLSREEALWFKSEFDHLKTCTKLNRFLFRLANFVNPDKIVFLGNDSGLSLSYLAKIDSRKKISCWGSHNYSREFSSLILKEHAVTNLEFSDLNLTGNFLIDFVHISRTVDSSVLSEFEMNIETYLNQEAFLVIENINKDEARNAFWNRMKQSNFFNVSLDLFDVGILIARKGLKKQDHNLSARSYK